MEKELAKELFNKENIILSFLQTLEYPIKEKDLVDYLNREYSLSVSLSSLREIITNLIRKGYDVRKVISQKETRYYLSRNSRLDSPLFKPTGKVSLPLLLTGDWHRGSYGFSEMAFDKLKNDLDDYHIKHMIHTGDMIQSLGVYSKELKDLAVNDIDTQVELVTRDLESLPQRVTTHIVMGGHEETLKGQKKVGFDALKYIATLVKNVNYYGDRMDLTFKNRYRMTSLHSSGGSGVVTSTKADRIWANLSDKPNVLAIGHNHRLYAVCKGNSIILETGTLQRETTLVSQKGIASHIGWWILQDYDDTTAILIKRTPKII